MILLPQLHRNLIFDIKFDDTAMITATVIAISFDFKATGCLVFNLLIRNYSDHRWFFEESSCQLQRILSKKWCQRMNDDPNDVSGILLHSPRQALEKLPVGCHDLFEFLRFLKSWFPIIPSQFETIR